MSDRRPQRLETTNVPPPCFGSWQRDREDKIKKGWGEKAWNVETKTSWRLFWRGVGTRLRKKRKLKEEVKEGKGDREEAGGGGEAADADPAAEGAQAVRVDAAEAGT